MEILVNRMWTNRGPLKSRYSIGRLSINGKYQCNTLELPTEDLDGKDKTGERGYAIPYGEYKIKKRFSPKFKRYVLWITKNSTFNSRYILVHAGNTVVDTEGCILVGENTKVGWLSNSRRWEDIIYSIVEKALDKKEEVTLKII